MIQTRIARAAASIVASLALIGILAPNANATPAFAKKEGKKCDYCHVMPGGPRNFRGLYYAKNGKTFANFDNTFEAKAAGVKEDSLAGEALPKNADYPDVKLPAALDFTLKDINGKPVKLARYQGSVIIAVNVASKCGNTKQYATLEKLYEKYKDKGLVVLGFPSNDFGGQEPGTDKEIKEFCDATYKVKFPLFSKVAVKGEMKTPFYNFLTSKETDEKFAGDIDWNFAKFFINRNGEVVNRYKNGQDLLDPKKPEIVKEIEKLLAEKPEAAN